VFSLVADARRWADWAGPMVSRSGWAREGNPAPGGVGAVRRLGRGPFVGREEIVEYQQDRRLAYVVRAGLPVRDYRAQLDLHPQPTGGTRIAWRGEFRPLVPGTGPLLKAALSRVVGGFARRLAAAAGNSSPSSPHGSGRP
jgi:hypothetical protein